MLKLLKAINTNTRITWKLENREKNHDILVLLFSDNYIDTIEGT